MYAGHVELTSGVPNRGDPDRKRALNVLAQRRYRQRKKERLKGGSKAQTRVKPVADQRCDDSAKGTSLDGDDVGMLAHSDHSSTSTVSSVHGRDSALYIDPSITASDAELTSLDSVFNFDGQTQPEPSFQSSLQDLELAQFTFSDDGILDVPILSILTAGSTIAKLLGYDESFWDPATITVLSGAHLYSGILPKDFEPVDVQLTIPHSPLFDIIPWPAVRTKLITVFSMPLERRPPAARDPQAIMNMVYDIDDTAEGFRLSGGDGMQSVQWEVGQAFFQNWWWALDRGVVQQSNALRALRGARPLMLTGSGPV